MLNRFRPYINRRTLISIRDFITSIFSQFSPKMNHETFSSGDDVQFDPTVPSTPVSYPIKTLEELKLRTYFDSFHFQFNKASVPLSSNGVDVVSLPNRRRMMVCHDMQGGYTDDKWVQGGSNGEAYGIWHWYLMDVFIYFSHNLVTLPPPCWVNAAHKHGVKALGTFIVEWDEGRLIAEQLLESTRMAELYAERLSELAVTLGFDGWLINMEVDLDIGRVPILMEFVSHLTQIMHSSMPGSLIIWYDSVTTEGKLSWQNQLNDSNKPFFDICDGIFINYFWKEDYPRFSATVAGDRKFDVYMGIDVFGRGTYGGGQWTTNVALDVLKKDDVSASIFAPGWVYETGQAPDFQMAQNRWWGLVEKSWGVMQSYPKILPFYSNFDQGHGYHFFIDGRPVSDVSWNNLSNQNFQPCLEFSEDTRTDTLQTFANFKEASYSGGGNITFKGLLEDHGYLTRRIFQGDLVLGSSPLHFTYSVKSDGSSVIGLHLDFVNNNNKKKTSILLASGGDTLLTMNRFSSIFSSVIMPHQVKKLETTPEWTIQESSVKMDGSTLTGVHALCYKSNPEVKPESFDQLSSSEYYAVLGHIAIKVSSVNMVFPPASEWHVESQNINWKYDSQGHNNTVSLKIIWNLNSKIASLFSKFNIYAENEANLKYLGVARVEAFYISELLVPYGTSSLKFIIQACGSDGSCQELVDSPFLHLLVEG